MSKLLVIGGIIVLVIVGVVFFWGAPEPTEELLETQEISLLENEEAQEGTRVIQMSSSAFFFDPSELELAVGEPVRLVIQNTGAHTFTVDDLGIDVALNESVEIIEFTPEEAGTFEFYCGIPGHREAGQVGTIIVR